MIRAATIACGCLIVAASLACGYGLVGRISVLPDSIGTIAVTPFENRTTRPEIEQRVTEEITAEFTRRKRYRIVADASAGDAVLEGAVIRYDTRAVQFTSAGRATRIEAEVTLEATLRERATDAVLWSQSGLIFTEQFDVPETGEFFDQETIALDDIARGAAGALVTSILEGF